LLNWPEEKAQDDVKDRPELFTLRHGWQIEKHRFKQKRQKRRQKAQKSAHFARFTPFVFFA
jgi:hypothetical protein